MCFFYDRLCVIHVELVFIALYEHCHCLGQYILKKEISSKFRFSILGVGFHDNVKDWALASAVASEGSIVII